MINYFVCKRNMTNIRMQTSVQLASLSSSRISVGPCEARALLSWIVTPVDAWATAYAGHQFRENARTLQSKGEPAARQSRESRRGKPVASPCLSNRVRKSLWHVAIANTIHRRHRRKRRIVNTRRDFFFCWNFNVTIIRRLDKISIYNYNCSRNSRIYKIFAEIFGNLSSRNPGYLNDFSIAADPTIYFYNKIICNKIQSNKKLKSLTFFCSEKAYCEHFETRMKMKMVYRL